MESLLAALDRAADGAYVIDENQRIVYWSPAAERLLGYTAEEAMGRPCYEIMRGRDEQESLWCRGNCQVTVTSRAGEPVDSFNLFTRTKGGGVCWLNVSILALPPAPNEPPYVLHLFRDVTELRQREQFTQQVLGLVRSLPQPAQPVATARASVAVEGMLTPREQEVLALLADGLNTDRIAESLSISRSTTRNHLQNILQKLQVHSRAEAVAYAFEHGLVPRHHP
jgi:PAS domain S-box-containing protein